MASVAWRASGLGINPDRNPVIEHANRGKRSVGIDISTQEGQALSYEIARTADVFIRFSSTRKPRRCGARRSHWKIPKLSYWDWGWTGSALGFEGGEGYYLKFKQESCFLEKSGAQRLLLLIGRDVATPSAQTKRSLLLHRRPGCFSSKKEALSFCLTNGGVHE